MKVIRGEFCGGTQAYEVRQALRANRCQARLKRRQWHPGSKVGKSWKGVEKLVKRLGDCMEKLPKGIETVRKKQTRVLESCLETFLKLKV